MKFKIRRYLLYYLARAAAFFVFLLPFKAGLYVAEKLGYLAYYILGKYRNIALANLKMALGAEKTDSELKIIARNLFGNLAKNGFELIQFPKINKKNIDSFVTLRNKEVLEEAYKKGRGVIILTAHFGSWELMAATLRLKGYPGVTVGRRIYFDKYDKWLNDLRKIHDVHVVYRDESPRKILKILKDNWIVGIVADQDVDAVDGVFVDFFGKKAYTPVGPVLIAKISGAVIVPTFIIREGAHHTLAFEQPVELIDTGDKEKDAAVNTQRWSNIVESYIRRYPDQWVWIHKRWKTREDQGN